VYARVSSKFEINAVPARVKAAARDSSEVRHVSWLQNGASESYVNTQVKTRSIRFKIIPTIHSTCVLDLRIPRHHVTSSSQPFARRDNFLWKLRCDLGAAQRQVIFRLRYSSVSHGDLSERGCHLTVFAYLDGKNERSTITCRLVTHNRNSACEAFDITHMKYALTLHIRKSLSTEFLLLQIHASGKNAEEERMRCTRSGLRCYTQRSVYSPSK